MNNTNASIEIPEPKIARFVFGDTRFALVWLLLRLYVGYQWVVAGWDKVTNSAWVGPQAGSAITGFLNGALQNTSGSHPSVPGWYAYFISNLAIPHAVLFSYLIAFGELAVGLGLIFGLFTGIAAFFGALMNFNYLFAGTISINPFLLLLELFLVLAWRNSGWFGLDRWVLPYLGVPWKGGTVFQEKQELSPIEAVTFVMGGMLVLIAIISLFYK